MGLDEHWHAWIGDAILEWLHTRLLIQVHGVLHRSVRVTPFPSYSVQLLEGAVIAAHHHTSALLQHPGLVRRCRAALRVFSALDCGPSG